MLASLLLDCLDTFFLAARNLPLFQKEIPCFDGVLLLMANLLEVFIKDRFPSSLEILEENTDLTISIRDRLRQGLAPDDCSMDNEGSVALGEI